MRVRAAEGTPVSRAAVQVGTRALLSDPEGNFRLRVPLGEYKIPGVSFRLLQR